MKHLMTTLGALMAWATPTIAADGAETTGTSILVILFLGLGSLIVLGQLIPALVLLYSMIKGLFGKATTKTEPVEDHK